MMVDVFHFYSDLKPGDVLLFSDNVILVVSVVERKNGARGFHLYDNGNQKLSWHAWYSPGVHLPHGVRLLQ